MERTEPVHGRWWRLWHSGVLPFTVIHPDHPDYPAHYVGEIAQHIEERRRMALSDVPHLVLDDPLGPQ